MAQDPDASTQTKLRLWSETSDEDMVKIEEFLRRQVFSRPSLFLSAVATAFIALLNPGLIFGELPVWSRLVFCGANFVVFVQWSL